MMEFLCFILPGIASAFFAERLMNRDVSTRGLGFLMTANMMLTNLVVLAIKEYVFVSPALVFSGEEGIYVGSVLRYLVMAIAVGLVLGLAEAFFDKFFCLRLVDRKEKEKGEKE